MRIRTNTFVLAAAVAGVSVALVDVAEGSAIFGPVWRYVSRDGGRTWHYTITLGGG